MCSQVLSCAYIGLSNNEFNIEFKIYLVVVAGCLPRCTHERSTFLPSFAATEAILFVTSIYTVPLAVAAPLFKDARGRVKAPERYTKCNFFYSLQHFLGKAVPELVCLAWQIAEQLVRLVPAVDVAVAKLFLVHAGPVCARALGHGTVSVSDRAVRLDLVAAVTAVVVVVAAPTSGDASAVRAPEGTKEVKIMTVRSAISPFAKFKALLCVCEIN
jgi:hypothetical protein